MFRIRDAESGDVGAAVGALAEAFAPDPLMQFLFGASPMGVRAGTTTFFSILLRARIALEMPAYVLEQGDEVMGAVMGYDTSRPTWPKPLADELAQLEADAPGLTGRFAAYDGICDGYQPAEDHHYLGVIGVDPSLQGKGAGKALLETFCGLSRADPRSRGVYLDTTNPNSLQFYYRNGFELLGEGRLGEAPVWCVYLPT